MESWRAELYHHGIKGQRWGVRKGPPYPLDAKDHSAAEKKAGWRKSLNGGSGEESKSKKRLTSSEKAGSIRRDRKKHIPKFYSEEPKWEAIPDSDTGKAKKMSSSDVSKGKEIAKKALLAIGITSVAAITAYALYSNRTSTADFEKTAKEAVEAYEKGHEIAQGLVQRNSKTPIDSLGKTFSNAEEFANNIKSIHANTVQRESDGKLFNRSYWDNLSKAKQDAVKAYSGNDDFLSYKGMNKLLRMGEDTIPEQQRNAVKKLVDDCASAIDGSVLNEDTISYRRVSPNTVGKMLGIGAEPLTVKAANELLQTLFVEKGFYSSSVSEKSGFTGSLSDVKITTIIPKGMKAMYVAPVSDFPGEKELLVQRGTQFQVKDFTTDAAGKIIALTIEAVFQP